jgi:hypothetical protein
MTRSISFMRPTTGSSLPSVASFVRLRPNWSSSLELFWPFSAVPAPAAVRRPGPGEHADDLVADLLGVGVEVEQDARRDALVLADEAEQDVLGADVVVAERQRLPQRQLEHLLGPRREGDLAGGDLVTLTDDPGDLRAHLLDGDVESVEDAGGKALLLAQQAEQDVLGADVVVLEGAGFILRQHHHLAGTFGKPLKHARAPFLPVVNKTGSMALAGPSNRYLLRDAPVWEWTERTIAPALLASCGAVGLGVGLPSALRARDLSLNCDGWTSRPKCATIRP